MVRGWGRSLLQSVPTGQRRLKSLPSRRHQSSRYLAGITIQAASAAILFIPGTVIALAVGAASAAIVFIPGTAIALAVGAASAAIVFIPGTAIALAVGEASAAIVLVFGMCHLTPGFSENTPN